ncbi:uncharacterized protein LOC130780692 [Actinidia eriantha]|uniref:uncharacterized protein LOC130780692 n=1 Tax=Actinidia eriantha TaxID=165200 RepID=UPI00258F7EBD|nr:uncharacterized protein LOC130780692 [Actinidia eriantha]
MATPPPSKGKKIAKEGKEKQTRRLWTAKEEEALLSCMMDCVCDKFRAENGFKAGFFVAVEKELPKLLPGTTLKANPNIESKVKNWKEKYGIIADAIRISGFNFNYSTQSIEVDDESVWEEYEKVHKGAKGMNGKRFPMFEQWQILFGKDRATGEFAEDPNDIPDDEHIHTTNENPDSPYIPRFENGEFVWSSGSSFVDLECGSETPNTNPTRSGPTTPSNGNPTTPTSAFPNAGQKPPKKKAKVTTKEASLHEAMETYMKASNVVLEKIADGVGYDKELSARRTGVFNELMKLDLDMDDRFVLNEKICLAEKRVDTFYGLPDEVKQAWVMRVLEGKIYGTSP